MKAASQVESAGEACIQRRPATAGVLSRNIRAHRDRLGRSSRTEDDLYAVLLQEAEEFVP